MKAIVIARDRVSYTGQCVAALAKSPGVTDIHIVDHGSTYEPMRDYLREVAGVPTSMTLADGEPTAVGRVHVHWRGNDHPRSLWTNGTLAGIVGSDERFIVTDCDVVVPSAGFGAGRDWVAALGALLDAAPWAVKAGLGLATDNIPDTNLDRARIRQWERTYQSCVHAIAPDKYAHEGPCELVVNFPVGGQFSSAAESARGHRASVDTTVAMYRRLEAFTLDPSIRTSDPEFQAVHLSWLEPTVPLDQMPDDIRYYRENMLNGVSHWVDPDNYQGTYGLPEETS